MCELGSWHIRKNQHLHPFVGDWLIRIIFLFAIAACMLSACNTRVNNQGEIEPGLSKGEVTRILGDPSEVNEFVMPDGPFFGPQEGLTGLVPAGGLVEEWVYYIDGEVRHVWFWGGPDQEREAWHVVLTSVYPKDAVY
jgi:hypothetical protein